MSFFKQFKKIKVQYEKLYPGPFFFIAFYILIITVCGKLNFYHDSYFVQKHPYFELNRYSSHLNSHSSHLNSHLSHLNRHLSHVESGKSVAHRCLKSYHYIFFHTILQKDIMIFDNFWKQVSIDEPR